jgi:hypothetical protein
MLNRLVALCAGMAVLAGIVGFSGLLSSDFDLSKRSVPLDQILPGGPGKDGIPALLSPRFVRVLDATFLTDSDRVLGLDLAGDAKAYPVKILNWHEIVNDAVGGKQVVITYCPLCGSGIAFDATVQGKLHTFGVSGLLYQSDLLMYDHQSESLWSQIAMEAVAGPLTGTRLVPLFLEHTSWADWKAKHPTTVVLSSQDRPCP